MHHLATEWQSALAVQVLICVSIATKQASSTAVQHVSNATKWATAPMCNMYPMPPNGQQHQWVQCANMYNHATKIGQQHQCANMYNHATKRATASMCNIYPMLW